MNALLRATTFKVNKTTSANCQPDSRADSLEVRVTSSLINARQAVAKRKIEKEKKGKTGGS